MLAIQYYPFVSSLKIWPLRFKYKLICVIDFFFFFFDASCHSNNLLIPIYSPQGIIFLPTFSFPLMVTQVRSALPLICPIVPMWILYKVCLISNLLNSNSYVYLSEQKLISFSFLNENLQSMSNKPFIIHLILSTT